MVIKAKKGLYDKLSRKELQSMCRLYGLPPNKKSLMAFLEEGIKGSVSKDGFRPENESRDVSSSSFQLYVRSEDGLNLYVDLNSSVSDWTKKFKREIHILENESKSWSLLDDLVSAQQREKSNVWSEMESSESEKRNLDIPKKRKRVEAQHQPNVKILRSMKPKKDLPRRSIRLMSKDASDLIYHNIAYYLSQE